MVTFSLQTGVDQAGGEGAADQVQEAGRREGGDQVGPQRKGDIEAANTNTRTKTKKKTGDQVGPPKKVTLKQHWCWNRL